MLIRHLWLLGSFFVTLVGLAATSGLVVALGVFIFLIGAVTRLWSNLSLERVSYVRVLPERRAFVGETLGFSQVLVNNKPLPLPWIEVEERIPEALPPVGRTLKPSYIAKTGLLARATGLSWYQQVTWDYELECRERGYYKIGPTRLRSGDLFGFFRRESQEEAGSDVLVLPRMYDIGPLDLKPARPSGELKGIQPLVEDPLRPAGVRDYRPGDSVRRLEWKATARRQTLQSRVYEPAGSLELLVALNINTLEKSWEGYDPVLLERAISVAASVARDSLDARLATGLVANGSYPGADRPLRVPPARSLEQLPRILEALAVISPLTLTSLTQMLDEQRRLLPAGCSVVLVTALMDEDLAAGLMTLAARHPVTVVAVGEPIAVPDGVGVTYVGSRFAPQEAAAP
ncbi:MAG TPA: DUF58 domain-containing protein [Dehalococcoidia bacterium]|nr:DUF58 domain-containing protein [Dehalococcoidia bacterium]